MQTFFRTFASEKGKSPRQKAGTTLFNNDTDMNKSFKIEVDCANCANLVENAVKKVNGVEDVTISFMTQRMKIRFEEGADTEAVMVEVLKTAKKVEPDFEIL